MSSIKISWGVRIALLYGGFVALIIILVVGSMRQQFDLVSADYYSQEIKYQEVIDASKNQSALSAPVKLSATESAVTIQFPKEFERQQLSGSIQFYSPASSKWDKEIAIETTGNSMTVPRTSLPAPYYKTKLRWQANGKPYYQESEIILK